MYLVVISLMLQVYVSLAKIQTNIEIQVYYFTKKREKNSFLSDFFVIL